MTCRPFTLLSGTAQDGGYPHVGCNRGCCTRARADGKLRRLRACLTIVDSECGRWWMIDCTPDFPEQLQRLREFDQPGERLDAAGILLTHAHIGHYTGLMFLGREAMQTHSVPVYAMPRMTEFLRTNQPWNQLAASGNIELRPLDGMCHTALTDRISIVPLPVPHRAEISETVAFRVTGPTRSVLYLPDIDQWDGGDLNVEQAIADVDVAYLDGTFFSEDELSDRNMSEVPHPRMTESLRRFGRLPIDERSKIRFVHLNHTNPALDPHSEAAKQVAAAGMQIAADGDQIEL